MQKREKRGRNKKKNKDSWKVPNREWERVKASSILPLPQKCSTDLGFSLAIKVIVETTEEMWISSAYYLNASGTVSGFNSSTKGF